ncbi:NepR family anti-sigma factor [Marinicauda salina]|uniref:NepR family anti-sigma factor n=1 Tax=Marinicauda salina TaxID=2135793 RepID=UPI001E48C186|nr:NepR family anti-sigma factor [Marinicauda salina]
MSMSENQPKKHSAPPIRETTDRIARRRALGDRLREYYDDVASEPVPDEFRELLDKLAKSRRSGGREDGR